MLGGHRAGGFGQRAAPSSAAPGSAAAEALRQERLARSLQRANDAAVRRVQRVLRAVRARRTAARSFVSDLPRTAAQSPRVATLRARFILLRAVLRTPEALAAVAAAMKHLTAATKSGTLFSGLRDAFADEEDGSIALAADALRLCLHCLDLAHAPGAPASLMLAAMQLGTALLDPAATCWAARVRPVSLVTPAAALAEAAIRVCTVPIRTAALEASGALALLRRRYIALRTKLGHEHVVVCIVRRIAVGLVEAALLMRGDPRRCPAPHLAATDALLRDFMTTLMATPHFDPQLTVFFVCPMIVAACRECFCTERRGDRATGMNWQLANTLSSGFRFFVSPPSVAVERAAVLAVQATWLQEVRTLLLLPQAAAVIQQLLVDIPRDADLGAQLSPLWSDSGVSLALDPLLQERELSAAAGELVEAEPAGKQGFFASLRKKKSRRLVTTTPFSSLHKEACTPEGRQKLQVAVEASFTLPPWLPFGALYIACLSRGRVYAVLNTLVHRGVELLPALWRACCVHMALTDLFIASSPGSLPHEMTLTVHVVWSLFAALYSHVLTVTDDAEFGQLQVPFALSTVRAMVAVCNRLLCAVIRKYSGATSAPDAFARDDFALRSNLRSLLRLLVDRNLRVSLVDHDAASASSKGKKGGAATAMAAEQLWLVDLPDGVLDRQSPTCTPFVARLLSEMPHAIPFATRVVLLRQFIQGDRQRHAVDKVKYGIRIRRTHCLQDAFDHFMRMPAADAATLLRARLHVEFLDSFNQREAGIDAGGVMKEFLEHVVTQGFSPDFGLFTATGEGNMLYPNPHATRIFGGTEAATLENFWFLGRVLGKAMYEGVVVNLPFAPFFLNNVLGRGNSLDDLRLLDPQQHDALLRLKEMPNVADAYLFFCVEDSVMGETLVSDIIENGRDVQVTNENVVKYLHLLAHHRLSRNTKAATDAFVKGLHELLDRSWLQCFNAHELQQLISGDRSAGFDVDDLRKHTKLVGGFKEDSRTLELLWEVLREMAPEDQSRFLQFCTGSSRPPLLGFGAMNPPFSVRCAEEGSALNLVVDMDRLPTASTCFNLLKLPAYRNKSNLREKLLQAIRSGAGFDLS